MSTQEREKLLTEAYENVLKALYEEDFSGSKSLKKIKVTWARFSDLIDVLSCDHTDDIKGMSFRATLLGLAEDIETASKQIDQQDKMEKYYKNMAEKHGLMTEPEKDQWQKKQDEITIRCMAWVCSHLPTVAQRIPSPTDKTFQQAKNGEPAIGLQTYKSLRSFILGPVWEFVLVYGPAANIQKYMATPGKEVFQILGDSLLPWARVLLDVAQYGGDKTAKGKEIYWNESAADLLLVLFETGIITPKSLGVHFETNSLYAQLFDREKLVQRAQSIAWELETQGILPDTKEEIRGLNLHVDENEAFNTNEPDDVHEITFSGPYKILIDLVEFHEFFDYEITALPINPSDPQYKSFLARHLYQLLTGGAVSLQEIGKETYYLSFLAALQAGDQKYGSLVANAQLLN